MSEIIAAYGIGVITVLVFVLIGSFIEERGTRKTEADNIKIALEIEHTDRKIKLMELEREEKDTWQKKRTIG